MTEPESYFLIIFFLLAAGALIPIIPMIFRWESGKATTVSLLLALAGSGVTTFYAIKFLVFGGQSTGHLLDVTTYMAGLPQIGLTIYVDRLAAFFLVLIGGLSVGITIYSFAYLKKKGDRAFIAAAYNLFVLSGVLFIVASNIFFFVVLLECVTLAFGALVLHKHYEKPFEIQHQRAIKTYLIANHIGGIFVLAALLFFAVSQYKIAATSAFSMDFFRDHSNQTNHSADTLVFFLAFIGFGIKAGIAPFHIWVAIAHPSSPTNTHAMSLGIMIKIALYGMIRVFFQFLHPVWWWGIIVLLIAGLTALIGVRNALYGHTLKDSLADHSVENIGIILAGIGLALIFKGKVPFIKVPTPVLDSMAGLALLAALYHLLNHTVFKGLLYLCTGAVDQLTGGVVELKKLGGLIHRYRWTSLCFLIGGVAIAGFPPFNGFISEWLVLQSLLAGLNLLTGNIWVLGAIVASLLLLASAFALTAFAFVKIIGEAFLGKPRDEALATTFATRDVPWRMRGVMIVMAAFCLALGIFPGLVATMLKTIVIDLNLSLAANQLSLSWQGINVTATNLSANPSVLLYSASLQAGVLFVLLGLLVVVCFIAVRSSRVSRNRPVWTGGTPYNPATMQYTSSTFTFPVRDILEKTLYSMLFAPLIKMPPVKWAIERQRLKLAVDGAPDTWEIQPLDTAFEVSTGRRVVEPFRLVYNGAIKLLLRGAQATGAFFQNGYLSRYLSYIFLFFIVVFLVMIVVIK